MPSHDRPDTPPEGFDERNRSRFADAQAVCGSDQMVCGTVAEDGEPRYFVMSGDASHDEVQARAFEVRNGRPWSKAEQTLDKEARSRGLV